MSITTAAMQISNKWRLVAILALVLIVIGAILFSDNYRFNKCVEVNREEFRRCTSGGLGNYDCSVFENAEELCAMAP